MKRVCSYCNKHLGYKEDTSVPGAITHGVCDECLEWLKGGIDQSLRDFLDSFNFPVLLIDSNVDVKIANSEAKDLIGKELSEIESFSGGDAIECEFARFPEGCGNTIHCKTCTIRNTVKDTFKTGKSFKDVPAFQNFYSSEGVIKKYLKISTEKFNDMVLLKIEYVNDVK
ncbi:MAG: hypothetical protein ABFR36_02835 [Acidobacteriota bacterium]